LQMSLKKLLRRSVAAMLLTVALYLASALAGSLIPRNAGWKEALYGTTIYVATNGYHTGIVVPTVSDAIDWRTKVRAEDLADPAQSGNWLLFGWGDREFYLNTPTWQDLTLHTVLVAVVGSGSSLVHVDHLDEPSDAVDIRAIQLSDAEYRRLAAFIVDSFARNGGKSITGYGPRDIFYSGSGRYSLVYTCNTWTADALAAGGVKIAVWTPFQGGVMRWF
jgi:uncharacterized protein (TIGR02117 family)